MEKLIELVNYYEKEKEKSEWINVEKYVLFRWDKNYKWDLVRYDEEDPREWDNLQTKEAITYLISKSYGFIKWLVDNDKIEFREDFYLEDQHWWWFGEDENIIMLLSIQNSPIDFLISILK
jgi:hypothetical protein